MNILYDGYNLAYYDSKSLNRSGIYTVTWNILCGFVSSNNNVAIYCDDPRKYYKVQHFIEDKFANKEIQLVSNQSIILSKCSKICEHIDSKLYSDNLFFKNIKRILYALCIIQVDFSRKIKKEIDKYDVYFSPDKLFPNKIKKNRKIIKTIFLHDTIPYKYPQYYPAMKTHKYWNQKLVEGIKYIDYFFANSECTKNDYLELCDSLIEDKILVTPLGCDKKFIPRSGLSIQVRDKYKIPRNKKYVFSLCNIDPRKNLIRIIRSFLQFIKKNSIKDLIFVIGGAKWDSFISEFEQELDESLVFYIGYVDDEDLADLYSGALWFTYTSQYEGFGLPPLEAMSCGCPVITSNSSSLPEVVDDAGIQITWDDDEQHIAAYEKYYFDDNYREQMSCRALERAKIFSWDRTCQLILDKMDEQRDMI